jgi:hypothetical protein
MIVKISAKAFEAESLNLKNEFQQENKAEKLNWIELNHLKNKENITKSIRILINLHLMLE